jgi:hypothetical protein
MVARKAAALIAAEARAAVAASSWPSAAAVLRDSCSWSWSRRIVWLVTGGEKAGMLVRLRDGDPSRSPVTTGPQRRIRSQIRPVR